MFFLENIVYFVLHSCIYVNTIHIREHIHISEIYTQYTYIGNLHTNIKVTKMVFYLGTQFKVFSTVPLKLNPLIYTEILLI